MTVALVTASAPTTTSAGLVIRPAVGAVVPSMPIEMDIAQHGTLYGKAADIVTVMGSRSLGWVNTTDLGDACDYLDTTQSLMNTPTSGQTLYLVSTSASDAAAGTGARTVRIVYLDADGVQNVVTATLNGTTPVSLGTGFTFIQWMEVATVGSGGLAAGALTVSSTNGVATVATTFEKVSAGSNRSLSGRHKVPSDCTAYLIDWHAAAISATMDTQIRSDLFSDDSTISTGVYHFLNRIFLAAGGLATFDLHYRKVPSGGVIKISAIPGSAPAGNKLDCSFDLICVEN